LMCDTDMVWLKVLVLHLLFNFVKPFLYPFFLLKD
jgi:hypothetical protein